MDVDNHPRTSRCNWKAAGHCGVPTFSLALHQFDSMTIAGAIDVEIAKQQVGATYA